MIDNKLYLLKIYHLEKFSLLKVLKKGHQILIWHPFCSYTKTKLSESHNPLVGLSRPLPSSWPGGRVQLVTRPPFLFVKGFFYPERPNWNQLMKRDFKGYQKFIT